MKKIDLKKHFDDIQERVGAISNVRERMQKRLDRLVASLRADYGQLGLAALEEQTQLSLRLISAGKTVRKRRAKSEKPAELAPAVQPVEPPARKKRHNRKRLPGQLTIQDALKKCLPPFLAMLGANDSEFTCRQIFDAMVKTGLPDERIRFNNLTLYMSQFAREHGLVCTRRKVPREKSAAGKPLPPTRTNFFFIKRHKD